MEATALEQPQTSVLRRAKPRRGLDHLVEHCLQARATRDGAQDSAARPLLLAQVLVGRFPADT
jgi:hypothetical protein